MGHDCPLRRHGAVAIAAGTILLVSSGGGAVELQQGQIYEGSTRLEAAELGIAFTVPAAWRGTWPAGSQVFILQPDADPDVVILAIAGESTREELASEMAAAIPLGNGLTLWPTGGVTPRGQALSARYEVQGGATALAAYGEGLAGSHGVSVAYVLIAAPAILATYEPVVRALADGTDLGAPETTAAAGADSTPSGAGDRWDTYLKGKYIVRYYTATGFTDEQHLWLCSNGSFARRGASGGFGGGASGAFQADSSGRWTATGAGEYGTLTLHYGDGSTVQHELRWDYEENKLYVDGKRWLHGENEYCD